MTTFVALIARMITFLFQTGTKVGLVFYFTGTVMEAGEITITIFGYYSAAKLGVSMLPAPMSNGLSFTTE